MPGRWLDRLDQLLARWRERPPHPNHADGLGGVVLLVQLLLTILLPLLAAVRVLRQGWRGLCIVLQVLGVRLFGSRRVLLTTYITDTCMGQWVKHATGLEQYWHLAAPVGSRVCGWHVSGRLLWEVRAERALPVVVTLGVSRRPLATLYLSLWHWRWWGIPGPWPHPRTHRLGPLEVLELGIRVDTDPQLPAPMQLVVQLWVEVDRPRR